MHLAAYDAQIAGLYYSIYLTSVGFQVIVVTMSALSLMSVPNS